jgi:hypothetical protein
MLRSSTSRLPTRPPVAPVAAIRSWASCCVSQVTLHRTSHSVSSPHNRLHRHNLPGSGLVDERKRNALQPASTGSEDELVADALRELALNACSLASGASGAGGQPLELLVKFLRVLPVLERESRTAVHNASRDCRDGEREWKYNV